MSKALTASSYKRLLSSIGAIYTDAQSRSKAAVNQIIVDAYWQIGAQIVEVEQKQHLKAEYGAQLLEALAADLIQQYGKGFSPTNLRYMRQFYLQDPQKHHARDVLSWTHHRSLLTIKDQALRSYYAKQAAEHQWSSRDLENYLKLDNIERERMQRSLEHSQSTPALEPASLPLQRGRLFCYRMTTPPVAVKTDKVLFMDLGFSIFKEFTYPYPGSLKKGDIIESVKTKKEILIKKPRVQKKDIFTYIAYLERIVDGDTLLCWMDLGFGQWTRQYLRLRFIDTPEGKTIRGQKAKAFVYYSLQEASFVIAKTYATDRYDRYLADIFYLPRQKNPHTVASEGRYLNQDLLDQKLAVQV